MRLTVWQQGPAGILARDSRLKVASEPVLTE